jgi:hypothetical protein
MRDTIELAREAGVVPYVFASVDEECLSRLKAFEALVRADEREACADIADRLPRIYRETAEAHYRLSPEPFKPSQFGFDYAELRQAESITYAIRARGNT